MAAQLAASQEWLSSVSKTLENEFHLVILDANKIQ
jgi:hypothetical protein